MTCEQKDMRCTPEVATPQVGSAATRTGSTTSTTWGNVDNIQNLLGVRVGIGHKGIAVVQAHAGHHLDEGGGHFRVHTPLGWATPPAMMRDA